MCVKGCPVQVELCSHHARFFAYPISMTDSALDLDDVLAEKGSHAPLSVVSPWYVGDVEKLENSLRFEKPKRVDRLGSRRSRASGINHFTRKCSVPWCEKKISTWNKTGRCSRHYGNPAYHRQRRALKMKGYHGPQLLAELTCSYRGCERHLSRFNKSGRCDKHLLRSDSKCRECGAELSVNSRTGYCRKHYLLAGLRRVYRKVQA